METAYIQEKIVQKFGDKAQHFQTQNGIFSFEAASGALHEVIKFLKEDSELNFHFLTDICGIHYPDNDSAHQYTVVYHLHNWIENIRIKIKTYLQAENPQVASVTDLFLSANWMERETYDFFGIDFTGHPQLKRILNMDEMVSFPMRKEYPMEDSGRTDKDDRFFGRTKSNA